MNFELMRKIDSLAGEPLLRIARLFVRPPRALLGDTRPARPPERVICAKFVGIGSVVLALPLLRSLRESGARVAFWTFPGPAALLRATGLVDEIWVVEPRLTRFVPSLLRALVKARRFRAQAFIDMEPTACFSALLSWLSGAPLRAGFMASKPSREHLLTHRVALAPEHHMIEHLLRLGELAGLPAPALRPPLAHLPALVPALVSQEEAEARRTGARRIIVNVNASDLSWHRLWPETHWIGLCRALLASDPRLELVFPGTAAERARAQAVIDGVTGPTNGASSRLAARLHNVAGRTSIQELIGLIASAELVVTVDSGIMHLASLTPTPIVALFGPETPTLFAPRAELARVIWAQLPCSPCLTVAAEKITACRDNQCMKRIDPEQVLRACRELLKVSASFLQRRA
jgi:ADP-heptose:LPS heptosyltransferase